MHSLGGLPLCISIVLLRRDLPIGILLLIPRQERENDDEQWFVCSAILQNVSDGVGTFALVRHRLEAARMIIEEGRKEKYGWDGEKAR